MKKLLQMIPDKDIIIKDFVNTFENPNKIVDTLYIFEEKGKTASEMVMRKVTERTHPDLV